MKMLKRKSYIEAADGRQIPSQPLLGEEGGSCAPLHGASLATMAAYNGRAQHGLDTAASDD